MTSTAAASATPTVTTTTTTTTTNLFKLSSYSVPTPNSLPTSTLCQLPIGTLPLENQVAGHIFQEGTNSIGLLKDKNNCTVLKPAGKPVCAAREIGFYKLLQSSSSTTETENSDLIELKRLVPEFKGTCCIEINNKLTEFIILEDLTNNMNKPCIMDIKIGKRTWDPEATLEKIKTEEEKYSECKKFYGLCIPGFQVYSINNDKLLRFSKEYGKSLNSKTFIDTIKLFLNYDYIKSKKLLCEILNKLLDIKNWSKKQKFVKLYSSSILILYDAKRLIESTTTNYNNKHKILNGSIHHSSNNTPIITSEITKNLPSEVNNYSSISSSSFQNQNQVIIDKNQIDNKSQIFNSITTNNENHVNKYDGKLNGINNHHNYKQHEEISSSTQNSSSSSFVRVKMIDFAHVFPTTDDTIDTNYLFGIENLVKIFEDLLNKITSSENDEKL